MIFKQRFFCDCVWDTVSNNKFDLSERLNSKLSHSLSRGSLVIVESKFYISRFK